MMVAPLAVELIRPSAWADAMSRSFAPPGAERRWGAYVCLAGEDKVWRWIQADALGLLSAVRALWHEASGSRMPSQFKQTL